MKKLVSSSLVKWMNIGSRLFLGCTVKQQNTKLILQSSPWQFSGGSALSALSPEKTNATFSSPSDSSSFTIKLRVKLEAVTSTIKLLPLAKLLW
ncbi:MAG: hypothetical protein WKF87_04955 [Chryseolinea sp.]